MMFHGPRIGVMALFGQQHGQHAGSRGMADMQRLGHGPEVGLQAAGHGGRHGQRHGGLLGGQADQPRRPRDGAENAERRGRMPALVVMMRVNGAGKAHFRLQPHGVGGDQALSRKSPVLGQREQGGDQRHRLMAAEHGRKVVEIKGMRRDAVDEGGVERAGPPRRAEHQRRSGRRGDAGRAQGDLRAVLGQARQGHADGVGDAQLGEPQAPFGNHLGVVADDALRQARQKSALIRCGNIVHGCLIPLSPDFRPVRLP